jgi:hypothetical protein
MQEPIIEREPSKRETACQANTFESGSVPMSRAEDLARRAREHLRRYGIRATLGKVLRFVADTLTGDSNTPAGLKAATAGLTPFSAASPGESATKPRQPEEVLGLQPGDYVEVKSVAEILPTLDEEGRLNGLAYIPSMSSFGGQRFKVFKRMDTMYQEESGNVRRLRNTVLLDGVHCDGLLMRCDRACFFYWREAWLRRVDGLGADRNLIQISRRVTESRVQQRPNDETAIANGQA